MEFYIGVISNHSIWHCLATMAETKKQAEAQIAGYLASYPGFRAGPVEWDGTQMQYRITEQFRSQITADTSGKVWHIDSGET